MKDGIESEVEGKEVRESEGGKEKRTPAGTPPDFDPSTFSVPSNPARILPSPHPPYTLLLRHTHTHTHTHTHRQSYSPLCSKTLSLFFH